MLGNLLPLENSQKKKTRITWKSKKSQVIKYELFCDWVIARPEICKIMGGGNGGAFGGLDGSRFGHVSSNPNPN